MSRPVNTFLALANWGERQPPKFAISDERWQRTLRERCQARLSGFYQSSFNEDIRGDQLLILLNTVPTNQRNAIYERSKTFILHEVSGWLTQYAVEGDKLWWEVWPCTHAGMIKVQVVGTSNGFRVGSGGETRVGKLLAWTVKVREEGEFIIELGRQTARISFETGLLASTKGLVSFQVEQEFWHPRLEGLD